MENVRILRTVLCAGSVLLLALLLAGRWASWIGWPVREAGPSGHLNWGSSATGGGDSEAVKPMKVSSRLRAFKFVEPLENSAFEYGFNGRFMQQVVTYWLEKYDWRQWEKKINSFENYLTRIEGLQVHFMHVKPKKAKKRAAAAAAARLAGLSDRVPQVAASADDTSDGFAFEVVAASLPGFAWSEAPKKRGFDPSAAARVMDKLMGRLGFHKYYVHGGDWGSIIGHSFRHPSILLQMVAGSFLPAGVLFDKRDCDKIYPFFGKLGDLMRESGYFHLQATRPDSVGHALSDSPVGLAAYILEKFSVKDGNLVGPKAAFTLDELLTKCDDLLDTGSITSSMRFYKEDLSIEASSNYASIPSQVPYGVASFPHELIRVPEDFVRKTHPNLLLYTDFDDRGRPLRRL
uniref:Epoxide hydrolase n=1 Tax=Macrostomum lignano TaxID=282301 RepID=A0A1I8F3I7_9PLAT